MIIMININVRSNKYLNLLPEVQDHPPNIINLSLTNDNVWPNLGRGGWPFVLNWAQAFIFISNNLISFK